MFAYSSRGSRVGVTPAALLAVWLCACGGEAPQATPASPGVSGGAIAGTLEVRVIDAVTGLSVDAPSVRVLPQGREDLMLSGPASTFELSDPELAGPFTVEVGATSWGLLEGASVVLPIGRVPAPTQVPIEVRGLLPGEAAVHVDGFRPARIASMNPLTLGAMVASTREGSVASTTFVQSAPDAPQVAVVIVGEDGIVQSFALADLAGGAVELGAERFAAVRVAVTWPGPPAFADRVVGVPGLALASTFAILPQESSDHVMVPSPDAIAPDARVWFVAEARGGALGETARSVVVQRGVANLGIAPSFPDWLEAPDARVEGGAVRITPSADAPLLIVDWLDAERARIGQTWRVQAGTSELTLSAPAGAVTAIVRAYDTPIDPSGFELVVIDATIRRFSERTLPL